MLPNGFSSNHPPAPPTLTALNSVTQTRLLRSGVESAESTGRDQVRSGPNGSLTSLNSRQRGESAHNGETANNGTAHATARPAVSSPSRSNMSTTLAATPPLTAPAPAAALGLDPHLVLTHRNAVQPCALPARSEIPAAIFKYLPKFLTALADRNNPQQLQRIQASAPVYEAASAGGTMPLFKCGECSDVFLFERSLQAHKQRRSVRIQYYCEVCQRSVILFNKCALFEHVRSHRFGSIDPKRIFITTLTHPLAAAETTLMPIPPASSSSNASASAPGPGPGPVPTPASSSPAINPSLTSNSYASNTTPSAFSFLVQSSSPRATSARPLVNNHSSAASSNANPPTAIDLTADPDTAAERNPHVPNAAAAKAESPASAGRPVRPSGGVREPGVSASPSPHRPNAALNLSTRTENVWSTMTAPTPTALAASGVQLEPMNLSASASASASASGRAAHTSASSANAAPRAAALPRAGGGASVPSASAVAASNANTTPVGASAAGDYPERGLAARARRVSGESRPRYHSAHGLKDLIPCPAHCCVSDSSSGGDSSSEHSRTVTFSSVAQLEAHLSHISIFDEVANKSSLHLCPVCLVICSTDCQFTRMRKSLCLTLFCWHSILLCILLWSVPE